MLFIQRIVCGQLPTKNKYWARVVFFLSFLFKPAVVSQWVHLIYAGWYSAGYCVKGIHIGRVRIWVVCYASCSAFKKRRYSDAFETVTSLVRAIYIHTYKFGYPFFAVGI